MGSVEPKKDSNTPVRRDYTLLKIIIATGMWAAIFWAHVYVRDMSIFIWGFPALLFGLDFDKIRGK